MSSSPLLVVCVFRFFVLVFVLVFFSFHSLFSFLALSPSTTTTNTTVLLPFFFLSFVMDFFLLEREEKSALESIAYQLRKWADFDRTEGVARQILQQPSADHILSVVLVCFFPPSPFLLSLSFGTCD